MSATGIAHQPVAQHNRMSTAPRAQAARSSRRGGSSAPRVVLGGGAGVLGQNGSAGNASASASGSASLIERRSVDVPEVSEQRRFRFVSKAAITQEGDKGRDDAPSFALREHVLG